MKRNPEHGGRRIRTKHFTPRVEPTIANIAKHYDAKNPKINKQYNQKGSNYDAYYQIKPEITYKKILKYGLVLIFGGIILNFLLAILMGKI